MFHFFSRQKAILNSISLNYLYAVCEHAICEHVGLLKSFPSIVHEIYLLWNKTKQKTAGRNKQKQMGNLPASDSTTGTLSPGTLVRHSVMCNAFADIPSHFTGRIKSPCSLRVHGPLLSPLPSLCWLFALACLPEKHLEDRHPVPALTLNATLHEVNT